MKHEKQSRIRDPGYFCKLALTQPKRAYKLLIYQTGSKSQKLVHMHKMKCYFTTGPILTKFLYNFDALYLKN